MGTRIRLIILSLLLFSHCKQEQKEYVINPAGFIYGKWRYKKHMWWVYGKLTDEQVNRVMTSTLYVEKDKIYFEGISFLEPRFFINEDLQIKKIREERVSSILWEKGPLRSMYTEDQLRNLDEIVIKGNEYGLGVLYLDKDLMILNYCGGVTFFMEKIPEIEKHYQGKESSIQTLDVVKPCEFVKLTYSVQGTPARLMVKDQVGKTLFRILLEGNEQTKTIRVPLTKVTELTFEVFSSHPHFEWHLAALVY